MSEIRMTLARNIRAARARLGLRQQDLAEAINAKSGETLSQIEKGRREVKAWELSLIAERLNVELNELLSEQGPEFGPTPLWRSSPQSEKKETESLLRLRSQRYRRVMELTDSCPVAELPYLEDFDVLGASYRQLLKVGESFSRKLDLGCRPAKKLFSVLEDGYCVMIFYQNLGERGSAVCVRGPFGPAMLLNSSEPPWRRNFSCAHELFHLLTWNTISSQDLSNDSELFARVERKAEAFASALLLPKEPLVHAIEDRADNDMIQIPDLMEIAQEFGVSTEALLWGMVNWRLISRDEPEEVLRSPKLRSGTRKRSSEEWWDPLALPERFVQLAYIAHLRGRLSRARLADVLETNLTELPAFLEGYGLDLEFDLVYEVEMPHN